MNRLLLGFALVGAFLAGGVCMNGMTSQAAQKDDPKVRGVLYQNWKKLGLAEDQVQAIYKVQAKYRSQIDKLETQIRDLKKQELADAEKILTPAQKQRLKEIKTGDSDKPVAPPKDGTVKPKDK